MPNDYRTLRADKLIDSAERLASRVVGRFPDAGLGKVALAITDIAKGAADRAEAIKRPDWWLRGGLVAFALLVLASLIAYYLEVRTDAGGLDRVLVIVRQLSGFAAFLGAAVVFLVTLETRLKRFRAVRAVHELRALAHIIDMHQLSKDPDCDPIGDGEYKPRDILQYLQFCTEMLAVVSKMGQLYVQDFPDGTTLAAVDQFENLATGLSAKIWQKIMILKEEFAEAEKEKGADRTGP